MTSSSKDPLTKNYKLPFSIDEKSFNEWLNKIELENQTEALQSFLSALKSLNQITMQAKIRFIFLQELSGLVSQLSQQLQTSYITSLSPFSKDNTLKVELSASCATELANNYELLCGDEDFKTGNSFSQQEKAFIIFRGIQSLNKVNLYKSIIYKNPDKGFWNQCYLFYLYAKQNNVLDIAVDDHNTCFISTFKHLLIFELSNTQQFSTKEILTVFHLLKKFSDQADLFSKVSEKKFKGIPFINLREDKPPSLPKGEIQQEQYYIFYISSLNVIKQLFDISSSTKIPANCNKALLSRLIKSLIMNQHRINDRELAEGKLYAIIGFDKIKEYILKNQKAGYRKDSFVPGEIEDLELSVTIPLRDEEDEDDENVREFRSDRLANINISDQIPIFETANIWSEEKESEKQETNQSVSNTEFIDKSTTGFRLCIKDKETATKVGDIIGLMISGVLEITVVRRIIETTEQESHIGVEVLGNNAEILEFFYLRNKPRIDVIFMNRNEKTKSIIINVNDFQNEEYFFVVISKEVVRYRVEKQLHVSSIIRHLKVTPA